MASETSPSTTHADDHRGWMEFALDQARLSPPAPTKFCVGAVLVDVDKGEALSTGYSMELPGDRPGDPGNTHAEHCCFIKIAEQYGIPEDKIGEVLPKNTALYTTMEPCNRRLSGNRTCVDRILSLNGAIKTVYVGIREPDTFIAENDGITRLRNAGVEVVLVDGMQERILAVSTAGHEASSS
ncbi:cytidine deaminase-like protein [Xylaria sp. FL0064]|nr:cytidine deaminase-like protein [Xylaria sp. FL0064]